TREGAFMRWLPLIVAGWVGLAAPTPSRAQYGDISDLKLLKAADAEHVKPVPPPRGATVLFDGTSLDGWVKTNGKDKPEWKLLPTDQGPAVMEAAKGNIMTRQKFDGHFKLHVEFRVPYMPRAKGQ